MKNKSYSLALLALTGLISNVGVSQVPSRAIANCSVTFRVLNKEGITDAYEVQSVLNKLKEDFSAAFKGLTGTVPCDYYSVVLRHASYKGQGRALLNIDATFPLFRKEMWYTLHSNPNIIIMNSRQLGQADGSSAPELRGRIKPAPGGDQTWIRFQELFSDHYAETKVRLDGTFTIYEPIRGKYIVYIVKDGTPIFSEFIKTNAPGIIEIDLPKILPMERSVKSYFEVKETETLIP